jgi:hypothetical protein
MMFGGSVFLDPLASEASCFLRGQPGPLGTAGANRNPDSVSVHMFLDRKRASVRHRHIHFRNERRPLDVTAAIPPRQRYRLTSPPAIAES